MRHYHKKFIVLSLAAGLLFSANPQAEVKHSTISGGILKVRVSDDSWQPDDFKQGIKIPVSYTASRHFQLDGIDDEPAWAEAEEVTVPLSFGNVKSARIKALYTDQDLYMRVRWADSSEDRLHHPWVWDGKSKQYVAGPQVEDSLLLSFEAGCEWFPSFLSGYAFDFDAWHWMAGRTDPVARALDLSGSVKDVKLPGNTPYVSRNNEDEWNLRFTDRKDGNLHNSWYELDRQYMRWPLMDTVYYGERLDGSRGPVLSRRLPPPSSPVEFAPQYEAFELQGNAADVHAKGHWENGFWTVELRRKRITAGGTAWDVQFNRLTQFSIHLFDHTEQLDQSSESPRLFLQFLPYGQKFAGSQ